MASEGTKRFKIAARMEALQRARETGNPKIVKDSLEYTIGVVKSFYDVDQLTAWLDFLLSQIDPREDAVKILREPYVASGKIHFEDV